jgi:hypothetical protein
MGDYREQAKFRDPYIFKKAEDFFQDIDNPGSGLKQPSKISYKDEDQLTSDKKTNPATSHGRIFRFNDGSLICIQFLRPRVWKVRFDPKAEAGSDYSDFNSYALIPTLQ